MDKADLRPGAVLEYSLPGPFYRTRYTVTTRSGVLGMENRMGEWKPLGMFNLENWREVEDESIRCGRTGHLIDDGEIN